MSHTINLKKEPEEEKVEEPSIPVVQPERFYPPPVERQVMEPELVEYETETLYHEWEAPEFTHYKKDRKWYVYFISGTAAAVTLALVFGSGLTALLFGLFGVIIFFMADQKPRDITYSISPLGFAIGDKYHEFSEIDSFWIHYTPDIQEISFKSKKMFSPYIKLPLGEQDPVFIRDLLSNYLPEDRQEEEITDIILRRIRF
jgi:hypothetical protein